MENLINALCEELKIQGNDFKKKYLHLLYFCKLIISLFYIDIDKN